MRKKRTRLTIEYGDQIEYCGTYERAKERVNEVLQSEGASSQRVDIKVNGEPVLTKIKMTIKFDNRQ